MAILPIGFFMPLPLAMMIPFMGIQSAVMAKQFGENFQYGKRRISAMSNEDFNKLTPRQLAEENTRELKEMIPTMKESVISMRAFQDFIIVEIIELMRRGLETGLGAIFGLSPEQSNTFFGGTQPPNSLPSPDGTPSTPTPSPDLLHVTIDEALEWSDNSLDHAVNNIHNYDKISQKIIEQEAQRRNRLTLSPVPNPPLDEAFKNVGDFLKSIDYPKIYPEFPSWVPQNLKVIKTLTAFYRFINPEWEKAKRYIDNVNNSGGSTKNPQYVKTLALKRAYERLIVSVNQQFGA